MTYAATRMGLVPKSWPEPITRLPPWMKTITGSKVVGNGEGVHTFMNKQSSLPGVVIPFVN